MIYTITFNPALDYIAQVENFKIGEINRAKTQTVGVPNLFGVVAPQDEDIPPPNFKTEVIEIIAPGPLQDENHLVAPVLEVMINPAHFSLYILHGDVVWHDESLTAHR